MSSLPDQAVSGHPATDDAKRQSGTSERRGLSPVAQDRPSSGFSVVSGSSRILLEVDRLKRLAARCGQEDAMTHLPYLLTGFRVGTKTPYLLLQGERGGTLTSAVLCYQYSIGGLPTGFFIPADLWGQQNVFAPVGSRSLVAREAAAQLMRGRALGVLMSLQHGEFVGAMEEEPLCSFTRATQTRTLFQTLPLADTLEGTLASLGAHTRRNLRAFRRRVIAELGAIFVPVVELTRSELLAMNRRTLYPVAERVAVSRLAATRQVAGSFVIGLKASDGTWLSVLGGRRSQGVTTVDWQMNAEAYPAYSLGTAMRAFLLEDEVARGTRLLTFDGGTPHTIHRAFLEEKVNDLLLIRRWLPLGLLRRLVPPRLPAGALLAEMLLSKTLVWRRGGR